MTKTSHCKHSILGNCFRNGHESRKRLRIPAFGKHGNGAKIRKPKRWRGKMPEDLIEKLTALGEIPRIDIE